MIYKFTADVIVLFHFLWIIFMIIGFITTLCGFIWKKNFEFFIFRTLHLFGILYVSFLIILGKYCPLTVMENALRSQYDPNMVYPGSFIIHYVELLVYPNVPSAYIIIPTIFISVFSIVMYIVKPPLKIKKIFNIYGRRS